MNEINAHEEPDNVGAGLNRGKSYPPQEISQTSASPILNPEWLASLSHELRSPLTAIQGYASMLLRHNERISSEERQEFLQAITQSSNRMAGVLDRFLDIANLEAGVIKLHPQPIDMSQLLQEVVQVKQQECPNNKISLTIKQEDNPTLPLDQHRFIINADSSLIYKMLIQLLDNAEKYSAVHTPIEVTLSSTSLNQRRMQIPAQIRAQLPEQDQGQGPERDQGQEPALPLLELSIRDYGIGIPIEDQERIFERFERVDMQLTRQISGLGLGLTMCKYIVALHYGVIWVESTPGEGSTFRVLFPVAMPEQKQTLPLQPHI